MRTDLAEFEMPKIEFDGTLITITNQEQVENWINEYTKQFSVGENYEVTAQNIAPLKKIATGLNKVAGTISTQRKATDNQVKRALELFDPFMKEKEKQVLETRAAIMDGIKKFEDEQTQKRHEANLAYIASLADTAGVSIEKIQYEDRWDNKTANRAQMQESIEMQINQLLNQKKQYESNVRVIKQQAEALRLASDSFVDDLAYYDLATILERMKRARQQVDELEETERKRNEANQAVRKATEKVVGDKVVNTKTGEVVAQIRTVNLRIEATVKQMEDLKTFMISNGIKFSKISNIG